MMARACATNAPGIVLGCLLLLLAACSANSGPPTASSGSGSSTGSGGGGGGTTTESNSVLPKVDIAVSPAFVALGSAAAVTWSATNASSCSASGHWTGALALSNAAGLSTGTLTTPGTYVYGITCVGPGGSGSSTAVLTVGSVPAPEVRLSVRPTSVRPGGTITLTWSSSNANSCTGSGAPAGNSWNAPQSTSNTQGLTNGPLDVIGELHYALTCIGPGGSTTQALVLPVSSTAPPAPPTLSFNAIPAAISPGQTFSLDWASTDAISCAGGGGTGTDGWTSAQPVSSTGTTIGPIASAGSYTYVLSCFGDGGSISKHALVVVGNSSEQAAPTVQISVTPAAIPSGGSANLTWSSLNADTCTASGSWSGLEPRSASAMPTGTLTTQGVYSYTLTCSGAAGNATATAQLTVTAPAASIGSFTASPNSITTGQATSLAWSTSDATSCTGSGGSGSGAWSGMQPVTSSGTRIGPITSPGTYTYTLACVGPGGPSAPRSTTVTVAAPAPTAAINTFAASPNTLLTGDSTTLSWSSTNASSCQGTGGESGDGWTGTRPISSSGLAIGPLTTGTYTYTLNCTGPGGASGPSTVTVVVGAATPPPSILSLTATPASLEVGQSTSLAWTTSHATACTASGGSGADGWIGAEPPSSNGTTTGAIGLAGTFAFSLSCSGPGGSSGRVSATVAVNVPTPPAVITNLTAAPNSIQVGDTTSLAWSTTNATACTATGGASGDHWAGPQPASSPGLTVGPLSSGGDTIYSLVCTGPGGQSASVSTTVAVGATTTPPASVDSLTAAPNSLSAGQSVTLSWSTSNASTCTASGGTGSDGWAGPQPLAGNGLTFGPIASAGSYTYTLSCSGSGGASGPTSTTVTVNAPTPPATVSSFSVSPNAVAAGQYVTLSWTTTDSTTCTGGGGTGSDSWGGSEPTSSNGARVGPLTPAGNYTYTLNCSGPGGSSGPSSASVSVFTPPPGPPVITLLANGVSAARIDPNTSFTMGWSATNTTGCTASGGSGGDGWSGAQSASNSGRSIGPIAAPGVYAYTLVCSGPGGSSSATVNVTVIASSNVDCNLGPASVALIAPATVADSVSGVCALGCGVANPNNVIDPDLSKYAVMTLGIGVAATDTLQVTDGATVFPAGRQVGFLVSKPGTLLSLGLLSNISIQTLLNGVVQDSTSSGVILGISALNRYADPDEGYASFTATKPFNAVQVRMGSLAGVASLLDVYQACVTLQ